MMGFFGFLQRPDLGQGLERFAATPNALLLDVRTQEEYADGHIPESRNLPLQTLGRTELLPPARETPLFVYCLSGVRSRQAAGLLRRMGYTDVTDLGGICNLHRRRHHRQRGADASDAGELLAALPGGHAGAPRSHSHPPGREDRGRAESRYRRDLYRIL